MRKNCLLLGFLLIAIPCLSQVDWGMFAGPQITYTHYKIHDVKQENEIKTGFQAGVGLKVPFENKLFFTPHAFYSLKGYKVTLNRSSFPPDSAAIDNNTTLHSFELAPLLEYDFSDQPGHFFIRGGPSLDFQLFGKEKFNRSNAAPVSRNMKFSFADYGHFAANLLVHVGYESANGLMIFAHYTHGIGSISNTDNGPRILHRAAGISIGKYFNRY